MVIFHGYVKVPEGSGYSRFTQLFFSSTVSPSKYQTHEEINLQNGIAKGGANDASRFMLPPSN